MGGAETAGTVQLRRGEATAMPFYLEDDGTAEWIARLAKKRGVSEQDAVRLAVQAELERINEAMPLRERIAAWRKEHPMPPATGHKGEKRSSITCRTMFDGLCRRVGDE